MYPNEQSDGHGVGSLSRAGPNFWLLPSLFSSFEPPPARGQTDQTESEAFLSSTTNSSPSQDGTVEAESPHGWPEPASNTDSQRSDPTLGSTDGLDYPETIPGWGPRILSPTTDDTYFPISGIFPEEECGEPAHFLGPQSQYASPEPIKAEIVKQEEEKTSFRCNVCLHLCDSSKALRYAQHGDICL